KLCVNYVKLSNFRKLFPRVAFELSGVDSEAYYNLAITIVRADNNRYKFENGQWVIAGQLAADDSILSSIQPRLIQHHDGAILGAHLLKTPIYFDRIALTNDRDYESGSKVFVQTQCKYRPVLSLCRIDDEMKPSHSSQRLLFSDAVMDFVAVTQYQNSRIIQLKNHYNPYAKGQRFRRSSVAASRKRNSDDCYASPKQARLLGDNENGLVQTTSLPLLFRPMNFTAPLCTPSLINPLLACLPSPSVWGYPFWSPSVLRQSLNPFSTTYASPFISSLMTRDMSTIAIQDTDVKV
ncbi:unnamed protein product, partial [Toxocara canis]|uniref:T-box domain-containing protein n=1 Tax=Toxocara canis TaxID=6265 RepID=A0A183UPU9_TOXCA